MMRLLSSQRLRAMDLAARFLVVAAGFSLNDLFVRAFGVGQMASPAMLAAVAILMMRVNARTVALPSLLLVGALSTYIFFGSVFSVALSNYTDAFKYVFIYTASMIFFISLVTYVSNLKNESETERFLCFIRDVFVISTSLILASPVLEQILTHSAGVNDGRFRGVFSNPNEACYVGIFGWILCAVFPYKNRRQQMLASLAIIAGVICTLSKGGIVVLIMLMIFQSFDLKRPYRTAAFIILAAITLLMLHNIRYLVSELIVTYSSLFSSSQIIRLIQITDLLGGEFNAATTTGRTSLWQLSLERFASNFPLGGGLGSFHFLVGGIRENGVWQGSHNLYLMMLGEAGLIPLFFLLSAVSISVATALSLGGWKRQLLLQMWFVLGMNGLSSHNTLEIRYILVALAITVGLSIRFEPRRKLRSGRWQERGKTAPWRDPLRRGSPRSELIAKGSDDVPTFARGSESKP